MFKKARIFILLIIITFFIFTPKVKADEFNNDGSLTEYENEIYSSISNGLSEEDKNLLEEFGFNANEDLLQALSLENIVGIIQNFFKNAYVKPLSMALSFISASLIISAFNNYLTKSEYFNKFINISAAATLLLPLFTVLKEAFNALCAVSNFMLSFVPTYFAVAISSGKAQTVGFMAPIMLTIISTVSSLATNGFLPVMSGYLGLTIAGSLTDFNLLKIAESIKKSAMYIMGGALTFFSAVLSLGGTVAQTSDNLAIKTTRFFISGVPLVGGTLSESLNAVKASAEFLKSTVGLFGIIGVTVILLPLIISLLLWKASLFVSSFSAETFGSEVLSNFLKTVNFVVSLVLGITIFVGMLFIIGLALLLKGG